MLDTTEGMTGMESDVSKYKTCMDCKQSQPLDNYGKRTGSKDGLQQRCKPCQNQKESIYRLANKDKIDAYKKAWASTPEAKESRRKFRLANRDRLRSDKKLDFERNKKKRLATNKKWLDANLDRHKAYQKEYRDKNAQTEKWKESKRRQSHKRRAQIASTGHSPYSEQQVLDFYGSDCHICLKPIDLSAPRRCGKDGWEDGLHIDHVIPIAKGGPDSLENVKPAHAKCNLKKWANPYYGELGK